jgi:hypothetical protein
MALESWLVSKGATVVVRRDDIWLLRLRVSSGGHSMLLPGLSDVCRGARLKADAAGGCYLN